MLKPCLKAARHRGRAMNTLRHLRLAIGLAAAATFALVEASVAETRVALVIGNGAYQNAPQLPNPPNDANDVAAALRRDGFNTILATDLTRDGMQDAAIRFARAARDADVAMFYYSGHAIQFAGVNYLAPVDIKLNDEADLRRMIRVDEIVSDLQQAKNLRILVLDSCRDNPLADQLKRSIGASRSLPLQRGLAKIDSPQGMIVAYATQAGRTADDGDGHNSPYTAAFLKNIEAQEEIGTIFRRTASQLSAWSPRFTGSLRCYRRSRRTLRFCGDTWRTARPSGPRQQAIARRLAADWHDGQNSASRRPQISGLNPAVSFRQEGRSRVVTNAGWDVVDARASARNGGRRAG